MNEGKSDTTNWREVLATPEAVRANAVMRDLHRGVDVSQPDMEAALKWFGDVGAPAMAAILAEAEQRGVSIHEL